MEKSQEDRDSPSPEQKPKQTKRWWIEDPAKDHKMAIVVFISEGLALIAGALVLYWALK